jgi:hypothetical protein
MTAMTRRELYDLVWSRPMREAARELGISDVGLNKVCVRHRVPVLRPGAGSRPFDQTQPTLKREAALSSLAGCNLESLLSSHSRHLRLEMLHLRHHFFGQQL